MLLPFDPLLRLRLLGQRVTTRVSSPLVLAVAAGGVLARIDGGVPGTVAWLTGTAAVVLLFVLTLALHEAARSVVARRCGVSLRRVDLYLFGGAQEVLDDTSTPRSEAWVGLAGLATLVALTASLYAGELATRDAVAALHLPIKALAIAVAAIALGQAMPALPLDGGRILRGWLWYLTDDPATGTRAVALSAHLIAAGAVAAGIVLLALDRSFPFWGLALAAAGLQLGTAARVGVRRSTWQRLSRALTLDAAAPRTTRTVAAATPVAEAVDLLIGAGHDAPVLVTGPGNLPIGVLRVANLRPIGRHEWDEWSVAEIMTPLDALPRLASTLTVFDAVDRLDDGRHPLALIDRPGHPPIPVTRQQLVVQLYNHSRSRR